MVSVKKSFSSEFNINTSKKQEFTSVSDYEIFEDKNLLDLLRNKIIQNISNMQI